MNLILKDAGGTTIYSYGCNGYSFPDGIEGWPQVMLYNSTPYLFVSTDGTDIIYQAQ